MPATGVSLHAKMGIVCVRIQVWNTHMYRIRTIISQMYEQLNGMYGPRGIEARFTP